MHSTPQHHLEIERKYEVMTGTRVPSFEASGLAVSKPETVSLRATYFDTASFALAAHRIAVRHRTGGADAGWHIKQRGSAGVAETEWPDTETMPDALIAVLEELTGGGVDALRPIGRIHTERTTRLVMQDHTVRAEFVDDSVHAHDLVHDVSRAWREWEVELIREGSGSEGPALERDEALLDGIERVLTGAGALPSLAESKISRTMGTTIAGAEKRGAAAEELAALAVIDLADRMAARAQGGNGEQGEQERIAALRTIARNLKRPAHR